MSEPEYVRRQRDDAMAKARQKEEDERQKQKDADERYRRKMEDHNKEVRQREAQQVHQQQVNREKNGGCFTATTCVLTPSGYLPIKELQRGASVLGYDAGSSRLVQRTVTRQLVHQPETIWHLHVSAQDKPISTTGAHSILTKRGWMRVRELNAGDMIMTAQSTAMRLVSVERTSSVEPVYNLHVSGDATFVVEGVVVHSFTNLRRARVLLHRVMDFIAQTASPRRAGDVVAGHAGALIPDAR